MDAQLAQVLSELKAVLNQVHEIARLQRAVALRQDSDDDEDDREAARLVIEELALRGVRSQLLKFKKSVLEELVMKLLDRAMTPADTYRWLNKRLGGGMVDDNTVYRFASPVRDAYVAIRPQLLPLDADAAKPPESSEDADPEILQTILRLRTDGSRNRMLELPNDLLVAVCSRITHDQLSNMEIRRWLERRLTRRISGSLFYHFARAYNERLEWVRERAAKATPQPDSDAGREPESASGE